MKKILIDTVANWLLSAKVWGHIQGIVNILKGSELSGPEKRASALDMFGKLGLDLAGYLLNLGIELAVAKLKLSADKS